MVDRQQLILAVDDSPLSRLMLEGLLKENGFDVVMAADGEEALQLISTRNPALILLDIVMPGIDGLEVCRRIKANPVTKAIPVIILTVLTEEENILKGFEAGAVDYVMKPFKAPELLARVRSHIELINAREEIRILRGILPVCAYCHRIRNEAGQWLPFERYLAEHTEMKASHGICLECQQRYFPKSARE